MFKIGDFSKLSRVTVKTLHHYDDLGLFKPIKVDQFTGYRYYSADQLPRLYRILAFKDLGLTLEQIAQMIDDDQSTEQIRKILHQQQTQLQQHIINEENRLFRVQVILCQIEKEDNMNSYSVILKDIPEIRVASVRGILPTYYDIDNLFDILCPFLAQNNVILTGPAMAIDYDQEHQEKDVDVEVAVPISGKIPDHPQVKERILPSIQQAASTIHSGPFENLREAYRHLMKWIQDNQFQIIGPDREIFLHGPGETSNPEEYVTEVQIPVGKI